MNTGLAAVLSASFSQRVQAFSGLNDEQLRGLKQKLEDNYVGLASSHQMARNSYEAASALKEQMGSLAVQRTAARAQLSTTPWYRPFKRASIRSTIASTESNLASVRKQYVSTNAAAVLASKQGAQFISPQMKQSQVVKQEIEQVLQARADERAMIMRMQHRARVNAHNQRQAQEQLLRDRPSMAKQIFMGMIEDVRKFNEEQLENAIEKIEEQNDLLQLERERPNQQHSSRPRPRGG